MTSMQHWTTDQWVVFGVTIAFGLAAVALAYAARSAVLGWTAPAPLRRVAPDATPRPSLMLAQRRQPISNGLTDADRAFNKRSAGQIELMKAWAHADAERTQPQPISNGLTERTWRDPALDDFTEHGIGALPSIQTMVVDPTLKTSVELQAEQDAWVNAYADLAPLMSETEREQERMRVAIEPALRTARLWLVRAGEGGAGRAGLTKWRLETDTCEIRNPFASLVS